MMKYPVNIDAGNEFVKRLKKKAPSIGGFNGLFPIPKGYEEPLLVSATDGVGTKIKFCSQARDYSTIGIDLVAMCVNDIITCGAKPLYFLDYISLNTINSVVDQIMEGILKGCQISDIELLGGETAEHPCAFDIDLAGFCTGIVEKELLIDGSHIQEGDKIIGLPSSGVHSNGYSLIHRLMPYEKELLTPTKIYTKEVEEVLDEYPVLAMAHITGGGLEENLNRVIPEGLKANIDWNSWERPEIFHKIQRHGVEESEMRRVFNCGIGYCFIVPPEVSFGCTIGEVVLS